MTFVKFTWPAAGNEAIVRWRSPTTIDKVPDNGEGESASVMGSIKDRAAAGVVGAIKAPFLSFTGSKRSRIRSLSAVQQLKAGPVVCNL